uniref:Synaptotagmin-like 4 n=1 Tax=Eptatretus burgeri TaxID=7764 RepID=A0A8C4NLX8_EPTBU
TMDLDLSFLTEAEKRTILEVIQRNEELQHSEAARLKELNQVKRKGARHGNKLTNDRTCARCQARLGFFLNTGQQCPGCNHTVCTNCQVSTIDDAATICKACRGLKLQMFQGGSVLPSFLVSTVGGTEWNLNWKINYRGIYFDRPLKNLIWKIACSLPRMQPHLNLFFFTQKDSSEDERQSGDLHRPPSPSLNSESGSLYSEINRLDRYLDESAREPNDGDDASIASALKHYPHSSPALAVSRLVSSHRCLCVICLDKFTLHHKCFLNIGSAMALVLYNQLASLLSAYSDVDFGNVDVQGDLLCSLVYEYKIGMFCVNIHKCRNLAVANTKVNASNPYVKTYLLPDKSRASKRKTSIKQATLDPIYNETLKYPISQSQLVTRTLQFSVWHHDRFGRNVFLGEAEIDMDTWNLENRTKHWLALRPKMMMDAFPQYKGELILGLKYVPPEVLPDKTIQVKGECQNGELYVQVKEARNLTAAKAGRTADPFVKGYLLDGKTKSAKMKTPVVSKEVNPVWNFTLVYSNVTRELLAKRCLELTEPWLDSTEEEASVWNRMIDHPNTWAEGTQALCGAHTSAMRCLIHENISGPIHF